MTPGTLTPQTSCSGGGVSPSPSEREDRLPVAFAQSLWQDILWCRRWLVQAQQHKAPSEPPLLPGPTAGVASQAFLGPGFVPSRRCQRAPLLAAHRAPPQALPMGEALARGDETSTGISDGSGTGCWHLVRRGETRPNALVRETLAVPLTAAGSPV